MIYDAKNPGPNGPHKGVFLDGVELSYVIYADTRKGVIQFAPCGKDGRPYFNHAKGDFWLLTVNGEVEVAETDAEYVALRAKHHGGWVPLVHVDQEC